MKNLVVIFCLLIAAPGFSQKLDSIAISRIADKLVMELNSDANEQRENFLSPHGYSFSGILSGCDKLDLFLEKKMPYVAALEKSRKAIKSESLKTISQLIEYSRYSTVLKTLYKELEKVNTANISLGKYGGAQISLMLNDGWKAAVFVNGNNEQGSWVSMRLEK